jgi:hypothetical protein
MGLLFHDRLSAAPVVELDQVKAARIADRFGNPALGQTRYDIYEDTWQLTALQPAQTAALKGLLAAGVSQRQLGEIFASENACVQFPGKLFGCSDFIGLRTGGNGYEYVRNQVILAQVRLAFLPGQKGVDFTRRYSDTLQNITLPELIDGDLLPQFTAVGAVVDALARQYDGQLVKRYVVARSNGGQRLVERFV